MHFPFSMLYGQEFVGRIPQIFQWALKRDRD